MKRIIYCCLLLSMAMVLFTACEEEMEVPKVEKQIISASNVKRLADVTDKFGANEEPMTFNFGINNALYFSGFYNEEGPKFTNQAIYKYDETTGKYVSVWHPDAEDLQVDYEELNALRADMEIIEDKLSTNEKKIQELQKQLNELNDWTLPEYITLEEEIEALQISIDKFSSEKYNLQERIDDIMSPIINTVFTRYNKLGGCSYQEKGYFYSNDYQIYSYSYGRSFLLEFNPATNRMKVILLTSELQNDRRMDKIFGTTEGLFGVDDIGEIYKFSFEQTRWEKQNTLVATELLMSSNLHMFAQSDKIYLMESSEKKIEIMSGLYLAYEFYVYTLNAPYGDNSKVNVVESLHDYGNNYGDINVSSVHCETPFVINNKLYSFTNNVSPFNIDANVFCEFDLSSNNMSVIIVEGMKGLLLKQPLCVMGNKLYTLYDVERELPDGSFDYERNLLYEITF